MILECIPNFHVELKAKSKPGMTKKIKNLFNRANKWHKISSKTKLQKDIDKHKTLRRIAKAAFKQSKFNYFCKLNEKLSNPETSSKTWWQLNKNEIGICKKSSVPSLNVEGIVLNDDTEKCIALNNYFASQCNLDVPISAKLYLTELKADLLADEFENNISLNDVTASEIQISQILRSLNTSKSSGLDPIGNIVLKRCSEALAQPLSILFNSSLNSSTFPHEWKKANVCPIFKKEDPQICSNYRPISLLSPTSKVFERIVFNKIYEFCKINDILTPKNSGFKKLDSTANQLIYMSHLIYKGLDEGKKIASVFLDISKAFDKVWHEGLLYKLEKIGIRGKLLKWVRSYLSGRSQRVVLNGSFSSFLQIFSGIPQGSILGPLLFLIYINDIIENIQSEMFLFADDTSLTSFSDSWEICEHALNIDLQLLENWSRKWLLHFNENKTVYMLFSNTINVNNNVQLTLNINGTQLSQVDSHRHLGVVLNGGLTWTDHVDYVCMRVSKRLGLLYKVKNVLPRKVLSKLYCCWIRPVIEYCFACFDNFSATDVIRLERLQRRAAVICTGALPRTETVNLLAELGWPSLSDRRKSGKLILLYKILNNLTPDYLKNVLADIQSKKTLLSNLRSYNVKLFAPLCRTAKFKNSFFPSTIESWNRLEEYHRNASSVNLFKSAMLSRYGIDKRVHVYNSLHGVSARILTQIRLGLSNLKGQLFNFVLTENPICPLCLDAFETDMHFFLECPALVHQRNQLLFRLKLIAPQSSHFNNYDLLKLITCGSIIFDFQQNIDIMYNSMNFVTASARFTLMTETIT